MNSVSDSRARNGLAIASITLGILAVIVAGFFWGLLGGFFAVMLGIAGIITGAMALKQSTEQGTKGKALAITGIVSGSFAIVLVPVFIILSIVTSQIDEVINAINSSISQ